MLQKKKAQGQQDGSPCKVLDAESGDLGLISRNLVVKGENQHHNIVL